MQIADETGYQSSAQVVVRATPRKGTVPFQNLIKDNRTRNPTERAKGHSHEVKTRAHKR
jgi:hypothetical protein